MLFDFEDYKGAGIIGVARKSVENVYWSDSYTTWRATHDAYRKAVNEWYLASNVMASAEDKHQLMVNYININDKFTDSFRKGKIFFNALCSKSIPAEIVSANGIVEGTTLRIFRVHESEGYYNEFIDLPNLEYPQQWGGSGNKYVLFIGEDSPNGYSELTGRGESFVYTTMTQAIYNAHKNALVDLHAKIKETYIIAEGISDIPEWIEPDVHPWYDSAELSGYVRDSRSLPISGAKVRLVDAEGVNHDLVTNDLGYYQFTKEYIYNNISFGTASSAEFDMFVLEETISGTLLYNQTSIFQNSFFGAVNNRDFTWPVLVKDGKPNRRNFKIEYISDYSNFPSFSGYIKDAAGNPIKDAFMQIKDSYTGYSIGEYKKPNGDIAMNFKYNDFGVDRTILTDENGFYEYTSQMVGEWFNKEFMQVGEVAGNLGGRVFGDYFGSREDLICSYDSYSGRNLQYKESFFALLIPYKQDVNSNSIVWEGTSLYDSNDYYASRFKYALTSYNEFQYQRIDLNAHYDIDVDVTVATNDEFRANKFTVELETNTRKGGYDQMQQDFYCTSTTGYVKIVYPATGESRLWGGGDYYSNWHLSINSNNIDDYKNYYVYSCDSTGKAMGYIKEIRSGRFTETIDLSGLKYLNTFETYGPFYGESIDFSGLNYLSRVVISLAHLLKNIIGLNSKKLDFFSLQRLDLIENIDISELTNLTYLCLEYLPLLESLDIQNNTKLNALYIGYVDITLDVTGLTNLNNVQYYKLTMTSDDVDDLLIQLASTDLIGSGNVSIDRISRSSYSDDAFNTLMSRSWNINLGGGFYPDLIEPTKLVLTVDPNLVNKISENLYTSFAVETSTGYWIGKLWNGRIVGYLPIINLNGSSINETFRLGTENATFEIYSCDYYGIPQGDITSFELSEGFVFSDIDTSELTELTYLAFYGSGSIESLDLKSNINLETINLSNCSTIDSIDVTGLTSLKHINVGNSSLSEVIGFSTLSSLETIDIQSLPNLSYLSFDGLNNIRSIYINEDDLYDSTHVDTMLSELNANSVALIATPLAELDVKQAEINVKYDEKTSLSGIDPSFAYGSGFDGDVYSTAIQSDGKIVVGGQFTSYNGTGANNIIRLNSDGSVDTSFVTGTSFDNYVLSIVIQSNGKILVGGNFTNYNGTSASRIIRLNTDGSVDTSFVIGTGFDNYVLSIAIQSDGKIVVGGEFTTYNGTGAINNIIRLNSDGSIDISFVYGAGFNGQVRSIVIQSDAKILVGGGFNNYNGTGASNIIRLNPDGSIDISFVYGAGFNNYVSSIAIQSDGKIVVGGEFTSYNETSANKIIRLNSDGSIDTSFVYGTGFDSYGVRSINIQSDDKIVVGGEFTSYNGTGANYIIRLNSDGSIDISFVYGAGFNSSVISTAIQSNGAIVVGGGFNNYNGTSASKIVSLNGILGSDEEIAVINEEIVVLEGIITTIQSLINDLNSNNSGKQVNTYYMARTSASDADYDSLIAFGWTLNLGGEFIYPYSQPVKGFVTIDWNSNENDDDYYNFNNLLRLRSNTGYVKVKSGIYSNKLSVNSNPNAGIDAINFQAQKGIMEFYCCDSHGRPAGNITGFGKAWNGSSFIKSFDISNLTDIDTLYFESGFSSISTIDLSSNINIKSLTITDWYSLESIVGFENLVNLKDIYMSGCSSLDIPVDFSSMVDLQRIYLYGINGINKNSRLNVSGLTRLQNINVSWTNILSVDLDNALLALDAAGLDSEFDFNYEGHLSHLVSLDLRFGMGIGYNLESASAFTSLQSKGWYLSVGDQIINSVEVPTKGIARWGMQTEWGSLYFYTKSGMSVMFKDPNGNIQQTQNPSFSFDSNMPEADRFFEFWAVDNYGRPRHDGITEIHDWWSTGVTSLEVNNIASIININIPNNKLVTFDISNSHKLSDLTLDNSQTLQSVLFGVDNLDIKNMYFNNCPELDIDSILIGFDSNGTSRVGKELGTIRADQAIRTHASDVAVDSLGSKNWNVLVTAPAGDPITITWKSGVSNNENQFIYLVTTTGWVLMEDSNGSNIIRFDSRYNSTDTYMTENSYLNISKNSNSVTFKSCTQDGTPSGEIVYINPTDNYGNSFIQNINYSLYPKLKKISYHNLNNITASFPNIRFLSVRNFNGSNNLAYDLSGCTNLYDFEILNYENGAQRTTPSSASLELPSTLLRIRCTGIKLNLDKVPNMIESLTVSYGDIRNGQGIITGINVNNTDFPNLSVLEMFYCNSGIINLDSSDKLTQFRSDYSFFDSLICRNLPKMQYFNLSYPQNASFTSLDLSELGSSISEYGRYFMFDGSNFITSVDLSNVERIQSVNFQNYNSLVSVDFTNTTWKNGGSFIGQSSIVFATANSLSEIIGLDTAIEYLSDGTWSNLSPNTYHSYSSISLSNCPMLLDLNFLSNTYVGDLTFYNLTGISNMILPAGLRVDNLRIQNSSLTSIDFTQMTNVVSGPGHMPGVFIGIPIGYIQLTENTQLTNLVFPSSGTTNGYVFTGAHPVYQLFGMIYIHNNNLSVSSLTDLCLTVKRSAIFTTSNNRWSYMYNNNKPTQDGKDALTYLISQRLWSLNTNLI